MDADGQIEPTDIPGDLPWVDEHTIGEAEKIAGIWFGSVKRRQILRLLPEVVRAMRERRQVALENGRGPAVRFSVLESGVSDAGGNDGTHERTGTLARLPDVAGNPGSRPGDDEPHRS